MFRGSGLDKLTSASLALAALLCAGVIFGAMLDTSFNNRRDLSAKYKIEAENYQRKASQDVADTCVGLADSPAAFRSCIDEQMRAYDSEQKADADLRAQQDMALWAFWVVLMSGGTMLVTAVGIFYVRETLEATRLAVKSADEAVAETRRIGEAQVRAYLSYDIDVTSIRSDEPWEIVVVLENVGQSPARNVRVGAAGALLDIESIKRPCADMVSFVDGAKLNPVTISVGKQETFPITAEPINDIPLGDEGMDAKFVPVVYGIAFFEDVFGKPHKVRFAYKFEVSFRDENGLRDHPTGISMTKAPFHNDED